MMFDETPPTSNTDRLAYVLLNLIGETVAVHLCDGSVVEGVFASKDDNPGLTVVLCQARFRLSGVHDNLHAAAAVRPRLMIEAADVMMIEAIAAPLKTAASAQGRVDSLARGVGMLERWADETDDIDRDA